MAGLSDLDAFARCLESESAATRLRLQELMVERLGVRGTPTFLSRDDVIIGAPGFEALRALGAAR